MSTPRIHRKIERSAEDKERIQSVRARYQAEKPTVEQLLAESGCQDTMPLGVYLDLRAIMYRLKQERQRQQLSLADVSDRSGIDTAALSRLESGKMDNPTIETVFRIAKALGKRVVCDLEDLVPST